MTKDVEEASAHELAEAKKATWASGLVAFTLTVVVIVLGVLVVTVATRDDKACTVHLPTDLYGAAEAPAGTHATSTSMGGIYPDLVTQCTEEAAKTGAPEWMCPKPFPKYATSSETSPECKLVVIGAGTGGLYSALRLIDSGKLQGADICVFELADRVGGRLYSLRGLGPKEDLGVDAGGYRTWPEFTPVTHALITEYLGLPVKCYQSNEVPCQKYVIVDADNEHAGFATFVETMMSRLEQHGVRYFPTFEAVSISKPTAESQSSVTFSNGVIATATDSVILNIPQRPLMELLRNSTLPEGALDKNEFQGLHGVQGEIVAKLYLYYPKAWWYELGLRNGNFAADGDATKMLLKGRYHDGHVKCTDDADPSTCHGFLQAVYAHDFSGEANMFFRRFQSDRPTPITIINNATVEGAMFLEKAHESLAEYHKYAANANGYTYADAVQKVERSSKPYFAVLATWSAATRGAGAGWHGWTDLKYKEEAENPLTDLGIYTINEAFSNVQGWADGSLQRADEVLQSVWDVPTPWSFTVTDSPQVVRQTVAQPAACEETAGGVVGGGGGGAAPVEEENPLCFGGDARLAMADGSTVALRNAQVGDRISTGSGVGVITAKLVHPVHKQVPVMVLRSDAHAELLGTRDHPVLVDGVWMELEEAVAGGLLLDFNGTLETRHMENFYNLEVDGDVPGQSMHSYVVNGLVASGNGDSPVLNARFPRQKAWQAKMTEAGCAASAANAIPMAAAARGLVTASSWEMAF